MQLSGVDSSGSRSILRTDSALSPQHSALHPGWGASSAGRARRSQRRGRGFKSPALHQRPLQSEKDLNPRPGVPKGVRPLRGDRTRGLAPFVGAGAGGFRPEPATEGVQIPCPPPFDSREARSLMAGQEGASERPEGTGAARRFDPSIDSEPQASSRGRLTVLRE